MGDEEHKQPGSELILDKQIRCHLKILTGCSFELKNLIKLDAHLRESLPEKDQELIIEQLDAKIKEKRQEIEMV